MFLRHNISAIFWSLFILVLCAIPGSEIPDVSFWSLLTADKMGHITMFVLLTLFCIVGFRKQNSFKLLRIHAKRSALVYAISYGTVLEILQEYLFFERTGDIYDGVANIVGCFLGVLLFRIIYGKDLYYRVAG
ncbi:MAG: VanZ family protein [Flavobacteriales bacterium]